MWLKTSLITRMIISRWCYKEWLPHLHNHNLNHYNHPPHHDHDHRRHNCYQDHHDHHHQEVFQRVTPDSQCLLPILATRSTTLACSSRWPPLWWSDRLLIEYCFGLQEKWKWNTLLCKENGNFSHFLCAPHRWQLSQIMMKIIKYHDYESENYDDDNDKW